MKPEYKKILLNDLSARLPYKVKVQIPDKHGGYTAVIESIDIDGCITDSEGECLEVEKVKPYLFPISGMTEEQKEVYKFIVNYISPEDTQNWAEGEFIYVDNVSILVHFYHKHHIDFRGLIEKSLALDATNLNIY